MSNFLFIVNPTSGKGKGKRAVSSIDEYCTSKSLDYKIIQTEYPLHATEIVKSNLNIYRTIISCGGDGTLNEVVNGFESGANNQLGVLPVGSGNDFTKNLGFTNSIEYNLHILTQAKPKTRIADVGTITFKEEANMDQKKHKFINNCGIGFDAYVGYLNQSNKKLSGLLSYIYAVFKALKNYNILDVNVKIDEKTITGKKIMISIGNGLCSGGGFYLNPDAIIDDGILDFTIVDEISRSRLLAVLPKALVNKVKNIKEANFYQSDNVEIELKNPYYLHCDGEVKSTSVEFVRVNVEKNALTVITNN